PPAAAPATPTAPALRSVRRVIRRFTKLERLSPARSWQSSIVVPPSTSGCRLGGYSLARRTLTQTAARGHRPAGAPFTPAPPGPGDLERCLLSKRPCLFVQLGCPATRPT